SLDPCLRPLLAIDRILESDDFSIERFNILFFERCLNPSPGKLSNNAALDKPPDGLAFDAVEIIKRLCNKHSEQPPAMGSESFGEKGSPIDTVLDVMRVFQSLGRVEIARFGAGFSS